MVTSGTEGGRNKQEYEVKKYKLLKQKPHTHWELTPILNNVFHKTEGEEIIASSFYEASIILIPKPDNESTNKKKTYKIVFKNGDTKIPTIYH